jgi:hypothetical protein
MEDMKNSFLVVSMDKEKEEVLDNEW